MSVGAIIFFIFYIFIDIHNIIMNIYKYIKYL